MNPVTIKTMTSSNNKIHRIIFAIIAVSVAIGLAGCDYPPDEPYKLPDSGNHAGDSQQTGAGGNTQGGTQQTGTTQVTYDVPFGWEKSGSDALYRHSANEGKIPFAKLAFSSFRSGTDADAQALVRAYFQQEIDECKQPLCDAAGLASAFKTVHLDEGDIYVYATQGIYSDATRSNLFAFARNGIVFEFVLYGDTVETYTGLIGQVMQTVELVNN